VPLTSALAASAVVLVLSHHQFTTPRITVPAGQKIRIEVLNQDSSVDEFDSSDLKVEEDLTPHSRTVFQIGPLKPGIYRFMGEAHPTTAVGAIVAR
jgi:heme/copper-type cytochrome/quinol oxidase subunit 2